MKFSEKVPWLGRRYQPLEQDEHHERGSFSDSASEGKELALTIPAARLSKVFVYWNIVFFCLSSLMFTWSILRSYGLGSTDDHHKRAWRTVNAPCELRVIETNGMQYLICPAPIIDAIDLPLKMQQMKGSVVNVDNDVLRRPPSHEVDEAWAQFDHQVSWVSAQDLIDMGKDPSVNVKIPLEYGLGDDAYAVETDVGFSFWATKKATAD
jgi:hypothetical protein